MALALAAFALVAVFFGSRAKADDEPAGVFWAKYGPGSFFAINAKNESRRAPNYFGEVARMVTASAQRHGVPVRVAHAIATIESRYNCRARSHANARGAMQVLPATARGVGVHGNLYDCATGIEAGMRYLAQIVRQHGTGCAALGLYERGAYARPVCSKYGRKAIRLASL